MIKPVSSGLMVVVLCFGVAVGRAGEPAGAAESSEPAAGDAAQAELQRIWLEIQQVEKQMGARMSVLRESGERAKTLLDELGQIKVRQAEIERELNGIWEQDEEYAALKKQRDEMKAAMEELFTTKVGRKNE